MSAPIVGDRARGPMTDREFAERYEITSTRGRIYGRKRLIDSVTRTLGILATRAEVTAIVDDAAWMGPRRGMTPSAIASDALDRIIEQRVGAGVPLLNPTCGATP